MTATAVPRSIPSSLLSAHVASLSRAAPYAVPPAVRHRGDPPGQRRPGRRGAAAGRLCARRRHAAERPGRGTRGPRLRAALRVSPSSASGSPTGRASAPTGYWSPMVGCTVFRSPSPPCWSPATPSAWTTRSSRTPCRIAELHSARVLPIPVGIARIGRRRARLAAAVGPANQGALHGARLPQSIRWGAAGRGPRPPGGTRRGVRIRHRLRQSLPGIRFRRSAGARLLRRVRPGGSGRDLHQDAGTGPSARLDRRPDLARATPGESAPARRISIRRCSANG